MRSRTVCFIALVAALAGCGSDPGPTPLPAPAASPEDAYIAQLETAVPPYVVEPGRARFIDLGYQACEITASSSMSDDELVTTWANTQGIERSYAEAGVAAARANLCPEVG